MRMNFNSERRGYTLILCQDLLGDYVLDRYWFGLDNNRGGKKRQVFLEEREAMREIGRIVKTRFRNGYRNKL